MDYEIVSLEEKTVIGILARTNNRDPNMGAVIGGLWGRFYSEGIYASIPKKANAKALGIYMDYSEEEKGDYTIMVACEGNGQRNDEIKDEGSSGLTGEAAAEQREPYTIRRIPAGRYARFVIRGDMVKAVSDAWQEIWQMDLPRAFQCDFEEYQDDNMDGDAEIHIYIGLKNSE